MQLNLLHVIDRRRACQSPLLSCRDTASIHSLTGGGAQVTVTHRILDLAGKRAGHCSPQDAELLGLTVEAINPFTLGRHLRFFSASAASAGERTAVCFHTSENSGWLGFSDLCPVVVSVNAGLGFIFNDSSHGPRQALALPHTLCLSPASELRPSTAHAARSFNSGAVSIRQQLRRDFQLAEQTTLLAPIADAPGDLDAFHAVAVIEMLRTAGVDVALLLPRAAKRLARAIRHYRSGYVRDLLLTDDCIAACLPAVDIAMGVPDVSPTSLATLDNSRGSRDPAAGALPDLHPGAPATAQRDILMYLEACMQGVPLALTEQAAHRLAAISTFGHSSRAPIEAARLSTPAAFAAAVTRLLTAAQRTLHADGPAAVPTHQSNITTSAAADCRVGTLGHFILQTILSLLVSAPPRPTTLQRPSHSFNA